MKVTTMTTKIIGAAIGFLTLQAAAGCSSSPPQHLVDARAAYQRAANGPAAQRTPAQLHVAKTALVAAEQTYDDEGDSLNTRDRAYVALRKAELAEVQAAIAQDAERAAMAAQQIELAKTNERVATEQKLTKTQAQLQAEEQRRRDAERLAAEALSKLSSIASVKQEPRGVKITLSGSVIFASGESELLPAAKTKLDQVANALKTNDPSSTFEVTGYTDSRGSDEMNRELSERRAQAVRTYLVSQGVPPDRITAQGHGETNPIASNDTPEGRANNRRVEILVKNGSPEEGQAQPAAQQEQQRQPSQQPQDSRQNSEPAQTSGPGASRPQPQGVQYRGEPSPAGNR